MKPTRNKFEMAAHDIQYRKRDTREARLGEDLEPTFDRTVFIGTLLMVVVFGAVVIFGL